MRPVRTLSAGSCSYDKGWLRCSGADADKTYRSWDSLLCRQLVGSVVAVTMGGCGVVGQMLMRHSDRGMALYKIRAKVASWQMLL